MFVVAMSYLNCNALKYVSMDNQECKVRPEMKNINSNEPLFYLYNVKISKLVVVVIISMIHIQNYMLLMLVKHDRKSI